MRKDTNGMTTCGDPDQQSDLGLHCLPIHVPVCWSTLIGPLLATCKRVAAFLEQKFLPFNSSIDLHFYNDAHNAIRSKFFLNIPLRVIIPH